MNIIKEINTFEYIDFGNITEPEENELEFVIHQAIVSETVTPLDIDGVQIEATKAISTNSESKIYKIYFSSYLAYSIINESYTTQDEYEEFEGKNIRIYKTSRFLDYVAKDTFATTEYPGPFKHYAFICLNHIVNVASQIEPTITRIENT